MPELKKLQGAGDSSAGAGYQRRTAETARKTLLMKKCKPSYARLPYCCFSAVRHFASYHWNIFEYTSDLVTASETRSRRGNALFQWQGNGL